MGSYFFVNRSCYRRQGEVQVVGYFLLENGWNQACELSAADLVILFTCAFCHSRTTEMLNAIKDILASLKPGAELIVGSCLPKTDPERLRTIFQGRIIHPTDFSALDSLPGISIKFRSVLEKRGEAAICIGEDESILRLAQRADLKKRIHRALVSFVRCGSRMAGLHPRVTELPDKRKSLFLAAGCRRQCSYCAIRFATGRLRSKPLDWVRWQFRDGMRQGFDKFELYADSIGDYGLDIGTDFGQLITMLLKMRGRFSIGIYDLHPASFLKYFDLLFSLCQADKVHYLYVPLQAGSERIMKLMHRPCNASRLKEDLLRVKYLGKVFLQTSIIIGFPTETENEFQETLDFLKEVDFDDVYVHFYSDMPGTESSKMNGKLDKHTMERRMYRLIDSGIKNQVDATKQEWENIGVKDVVFVPPVKSYVLEELATNENYDEKSYLLANPDVAKAVERGEFESGRVHFELFGKNERRMLCVLDKSRKERY